MKGVSQKQVAKLLGIKDRTWIYRWESGYILPSLVNAGRLSLLYEAKIEVLFPGLTGLAAERKNGVFERRKAICGWNRQANPMNHHEWGRFEQPQGY